MRKLIIIVILQILLLITPSQGIAESRTVSIDVPTLNVRSGPGLSYNVLAKVNKGNQYTVLSQKKDWIKIQLPDNQTGWVADWFVSVTRSSIEQEEVAEVNQLLGHVSPTVNYLRIRSEPNLNSKTLDYAMIDMQYPFVEQEGEWVRITYENQDAWVASKYVTVSLTNKNEIIENSSSIQQTGEVNVSVLNMRNEPSLTSEIVGKLQEGSKVKILSTEDQWIEVEFKNKKAWVFKTYITLSENKINQEDTTPSVPIEKAPIKSIGTIQASALNVRDQSSLQGSVLGQLKQGEEVSILKEENKWYQIQYKDTSGWVASWFVEEKKLANNDSPSAISGQISIKVDGTNIRKGPSLSEGILTRATSGQTFEVTGIEGDWYKIQLSSSSEGYVAGWVVNSLGNLSKIEKPGANHNLKGRTIVIDPGHGGRDVGTIGISGAHEKDITLRTAKLLYTKLRASGANVILTRNNDTYLTLSSRVSIAHQYNADAFISLHYDSINIPSLQGITSYYYSQYKDRPLATILHNKLIDFSGSKNRGIRYGNYHVLRENNQSAALLELGYLSNSQEEIRIQSANYQDSITNALYYGLSEYLQKN